MIGRQLLVYLEKKSAAVFLLPPTLLVVMMAIFPLFMSLGLAFVHWNIANPSAGISWAGLTHWSRLIEDDHFHRVARNTILYLIIGVPIQYGLGLTLAVVLNNEIRAKAFFRLLFLLPMMLSPVAIAFIVGRVMFNEALGPVNQILEAMGMDPVPWLTNSFLALITVIIVDTWQWTPFMILILLAGLQAIPEEVVEAGHIETKSDWQAFWKVTFPLLLPWSITAVLIRSIEMLKIVDVIVVLTNGGPGISTESMTLFAYRVGVVDFDLGYASALAFTLLFFAIIATTIFLGLLRRSIAYSTE